MRLGRGDQLGALESRWERAREGRGGLVLVTGEAGSGKSTLVEALVGPAAAADVEVLAGACDQLSTPRPLGPVHDLAPRLGDLTRTAAGAPRPPHEIYAAVFEQLAARPSILVVEDLHWADQATIDLLRFLLRRIGAIPALVVGTVRDDEIGPAHPLRALLGDVARSPDASRVAVPPLTVDEVAVLADGRHLDPGWLHRVTDGNAFFVSEMLDHGSDDVADLPSTVRDAILARTAPLDPDAWDLLHLLACSPEAIPDHLLAPLGIGIPRLRALDQAGLIRRSSRGVSFRHDLCRTAIAETIPPGADVELHRRMLDAISSVPGADPAVLVHHAVGARDGASILEHAARAGRAAAGSGAHTQAADFFEIALDHAARTPPAQQAELLELLAEECYLIDRLDEAIAASQRALRLHAGLLDPVGMSVNHRLLSIYHWYDADRDSAERHAQDAVDALAGAAAPGAQGHAVATQAYLALQASDLDRARALTTLAAEVGAAVDPLLRVRTSILTGICDVLEASPTGRDAMLALLAPAGADLDEVYSSGFSNMTYLDVDQRRLGEAADLLGTSIPMTVERDLPICRVWQIGSRARLKLIEGRWDDAVVDADEVLVSPSAPLARTWPHVVRALVALRRGGGDDDAVAADLDAAWSLAHRLREPMRTLPVAAAVAERAWLTGADDERLGACHDLLASARGGGLAWARGELATRLRRLGDGVAVDSDGGDVAEPYALELAGRYEAAAERWEAIGAPYEQALALVDSEPPEVQRTGLDLLDELGADVTASWFRRDLRRRGVAKVPQRRRRSTMANAAGLTARQLDVLAALADGLTNAELADRLFISAKTADHHVSAILGKLGVSTRRDAVRAARDLDLID